eukprot:scaffold2175_cov381-Prasinococcus_capsulatus_cf.AAC.2
MGEEEASLRATARDMTSAPIAGGKVLPEVAGLECRASAAHEHRASINGIGPRHEVYLLGEKSTGGHREERQCAVVAFNGTHLGGNLYLSAQTNRDWLQ